MWKKVVELVGVVRRFGADFGVVVNNEGIKFTNAKGDRDLTDFMDEKTAWKYLKNYNVNEK